MTITETYFGYQQPLHAQGCRATGWEVRYREAYDTPRGGGEHECRNPKCEDHRSEYTELRVQILCRSCDRILDLTGEALEFRHTPLAAVGYGTPPVKAGPVWLYAGQQILIGEPEVFGYLVAGRRTADLVQADVLGQVSCYTTPRGALRWKAEAQPSWHRDGVMVVFGATEDGFATPTAAAKWIATQGRLDR
ncbi:hypothetical protein ACFY4B_27125 [Kitasatospora sp. NPDC001261]|uniref:hypothetical protein n=1 Tax=Kitasatospora sp. NPDC001261 TaxID=3364012 RepID=UPI0036BCFC28